MLDRRIPAVLAVAAVAVGGAVAAAAMGGEDRSSEAAVAERGAKVMPFSLAATTHVFEPTGTGGTQRVVADDPRDRQEIGLIREHLREEASAFQRGDFADPASIHGANMPGLEALETGFERIAVGYGDLPDGAEITYRTDDRALTRALEDWFDAQLRDHGGDATAGNDRSAEEHSSPHQ